MGMTSEVSATARDRSTVDSRLSVGYWPCAGALCGVWVALRVAGFARTLRLVRSRVERRPTIAASIGEVRRVAHHVATVGAFFPGRALCLEQSLALYWLLRGRGVVAKLRVGVQPAPFTAHAWVEYEGVPINEDDDRIRELLPLPIDGTEAT